MIASSDAAMTTEQPPDAIWALDRHPSTGRDGAPRRTALLVGEDHLQPEQVSPLKSRSVDFNSDALDDFNDHRAGRGSSGGVRRPLIDW
jgi:hypothetical protein